MFRGGGFYWPTLYMYYSETSGHATDRLVLETLRYK